MDENPSFNLATQQEKACPERSKISSGIVGRTEATEGIGKVKATQNNRATTKVRLQKGQPSTPLSVSCFENVRRVEFLLEDVIVGQASVDIACLIAFHGKDYVGEGSLKFCLREEDISPH